MVALKTVPIPGYAEAIAKEQRARLLAFVESPEIVCGVPVRSLSLRVLVWLEIARNGFVVPCAFDDEREAQAHAVQALYFSRYEFDPRRLVDAGIITRVIEEVRREKFIRRVLKLNPGKMKIADRVAEWFADSFMDAPKGSGENGNWKSYAAYPAYLSDAFASAGMRFSFDEIMDMPIRRLWQHWRVAMKRMNPKMGLLNPSDELAIQHIQGGKKA